MDLTPKQQATVLKRGELVGRRDDSELYLYRGRFYCFGKALAFQVRLDVVSLPHWQPA